MDALACATTLPRIAVRRRPYVVSAERPRLSVVIVNYLRWDDTARLVRQLRQSAALRNGAAEIVIVDNHSPHHGIVTRLRRAAGISLRRWKRNRGFARAVNEGCRLSRGDWVLLLNPDTSVPPGFLDEILSGIDRLPPHAGIVGFQLYNDDGTRQLSTGRFPDLAATLTRLVLPRSLRKYTAPSADGPCEVDWVTGCCLLVRRDCLLDVGGLDDTFFLYYEDVDLCRRARQRGWSVWFDPTTAVIHHRPLHSRAVPSHLRVITRHALLTYASKHWPRWQLPILGGIMRVEAFARRWQARLRGDTAGERMFAELSLLVRDVLRGQPDEAQARLARVVHHEELQRASCPLDRHPQPQTARPAAAVPGKRAAVRAAGHASSGGR